MVLREKGHVVMDRFRVGGLDPHRRYLHVRVIVCRNREELGAMTKLPEDDLWRPSALFVPVGYEMIAKSGGLVGSIWLCPGPKIEAFAIHESIHAAFHVSGYRMTWSREGQEWEEFIARTSEEIFWHISKRIRAKGISQRRGK